MDREFELSLHPEPFWLQEAFACLNYIPALDSEEWLNKSDGRSRRQKEEFLLPYRSYRGTMRARLQPIMEQFSLLAGYVDSAPRNQENAKSNEPPMMLFLVQMQHVLEAEELPSEESLETELNLAFQRMLESSLPDSQGMPESILQDSTEKGSEISGLPDVMAALEAWQGSDGDKFKLLRLYSERREVVEQLWNFQGACTEIGRECLESLRECFDACMEELKKPETVGNLCDRVGIQGGGKFSGHITPVILPYNRCLIEIRTLQENPWHLQMNLHIGIAFFYLFHSEGESLHHDERLLSQLKSLSDPTRLKILHRLVERPCYLQEMAKALGLTPATVLHHVGVLMSGKLIEIQMTTEKKKVYYQIRKQGLEEVSQEILQLAMTQKEREEHLMRAAREENGGRSDVQIYEKTLGIGAAGIVPQHHDPDHRAGERSPGTKHD